MFETPKPEDSDPKNKPMSANRSVTDLFEAHCARQQLTRGLQVDESLRDIRRAVQVVAAINSCLEAASPANPTRADLCQIRTDLRGRTYVGLAVPKVGENEFLIPAKPLFLSSHSGLFKMLTLHPSHFNVHGETGLLVVSEGDSHKGVGVYPFFSDQGLGALLEEAEEISASYNTFLSATGNLWGQSCGTLSLLLMAGKALNEFENAHIDELLGDRYAHPIPVGISQFRMDSAGSFFTVGIAYLPGMGASLQGEILMPSEYRECQIELMPFLPNNTGRIDFRVGEVRDLPLAA